jgi:hypothetical protein
MTSGILKIKTPPFKISIKKICYSFIFLFISSCTKSLETNYSKKSNNIGGPLVTRSEVVLTADKYARLKWFMAEINVKGVDCSDSFMSEYPVGPRIGMGYKFGGWDSTETFLQKIAKGYGTGTGVETYRKIPFDCGTGISCTGLVSRAWQLNHKYTFIYPNQPDVPRQFNEITNILPVQTSISRALR